MVFKNTRSKFSVSNEALEKIRNFIVSSVHTADTHNINEYWQDRRLSIKLNIIDGGVEVLNNTALDSRLEENEVLQRTSTLFMLLIKAINRLVQIPLLFLIKLRDKTNSIIKQDRPRSLYLLLINQREKWFSFGLWSRPKTNTQDTLHNSDQLRTGPIYSMIKAWPLRLFVNLRVVDVINHFVFEKKDGNNKVRVLEIGSGSSILCGLMMHTFGSKHVLVDLPEQIVVGYSLLSEFFPDKRILLPHEINKASITEGNADVIYITPEQISLLDESSFDIGINMFSFMEMSYETINEYFDLLRIAIKSDGIFYCMNRVSKKNKYDGTTSEFAKYPWHKKDKNLHDLTLDEYFEKIKICGGQFRERVVNLARVDT